MDKADLMVLLIVVANCILFYLLFSRVITLFAVNEIPDICNEAEHLDLEEVYFEWPTNSQPGIKLTGKSIYQNDIRNLARKYTVPFEQNSELKMLIITANLIPENEDPYDGNTVRVDIDNITVGYIKGKNASRFRRKVRDIKVDSHITQCKAIISETKVEEGEDNNYVVELQIAV